MWVSPFRHLRVKGYVLLSAAFRSLSRLSSALSAKASALCPSLLNLISFYRMHSVACPGTVFVLLFLLITRTFCISAFPSGYLGCLIRIFKLFFYKVSVFGFQGTPCGNQCFKISTSWLLCSHLNLLPSGKKLSRCTRTCLYFIDPVFFLIIRQPPALPYRLQYSTIGRLSLNHRVRDGYGCLP